MLGSSSRHGDRGGVIVETKAYHDSGAACRALRRRDAAPAASCSAARRA